MARATWSGFLSFGLVSVPVGLYTATADQTIHFNQLHKGTSNRVRYKKVDEDTGEELSTEDIVNGYPLGGGEYVVVTREEMAAPRPGSRSSSRSRTSSIWKRSTPSSFVSPTTSPQGQGSDRAYALLLEAMSETNKVGIATLVLRDKEHLVAIRPSEKVLMLETMYFEDEIRDPQQELDTLPEIGNASPRELKIAKQLIESLTDEWEPPIPEHVSVQRIEELIEKKREGNAVVFGDEERPKSNVVDLMSALQASIERSSARAAPKGRGEVSTAKQISSLKVSEHREKLGLDAMTKADLLERATKPKLDVNAKMTKPELVKALADAKKPAKKTTRRVS